MAIRDIDTLKETSPTTQDLLQQIALLRAEVESLREERNDLELLLETTTDHSDVMEEELHNKAEEALRKSAEQLRMIIGATPVPVMISRIHDGQIVYANMIAGPLFGLSSQALLQRRTLEFYHNPDDRAALFAKLEREGEVGRASTGTVGRRRSRHRIRHKPRPRNH